MNWVWDTVGYVISSKYRRTVIDQLSDGASTPTTLASTASISTTHVSRALEQLRDRGVVTLAVPEDQVKRREYELTERGEAVERVIDESRLGADC